MSELKYEKLGDMMPFYPRSTLVIRKQFVDETIAELQANNKSALKAVSYWHDNYCELQKVVDSLQTKSECKEDKIRILKRALWLERAERAKEMCRRLLIQGFDPKWENVERKCRAKAEQYK